MEIWHLFIVANGETEINGQDSLKLTQKGVNQLRFAGTTIEGILANTQASRKFTEVLSSEELRDFGSLNPLLGTITEINEVTVTDRWPSTTEPITNSSYKIRMFVQTKLTLERTKVLMVMLPPHWANELKKLFLNDSPEAQQHSLYSTEMKPGDIIEIIYTDELLTEVKIHESP